MRDELKDEIEFHLEMLVRDLLASGLTADEAREEAARRFGDAGTVRAALAGLRWRRWSTIATLAALAVAMFMQSLLVRLGWYRGLYHGRPFYVPESLKNLGQVALCAAALWAMRERSLLRAVALDRRLVPAFAVMLAATSPMLIGFALTRGSTIADPLAVVYLALVSPFAEEVVTRGFSFRALRRAGWPLWPAALLCACVTGLAHIEKGQTAASILGLFALTALGSVTFCWLVERWGSLWFAFALHALMNLWWEIFNVAPTALGGWFAFLVQCASIGLAVLITLRLTPRPGAHPRRAEEKAGRWPWFASRLEAAEPSLFGVR